MSKKIGTYEQRPTGVTGEQGVAVPGAKSVTGLKHKEPSISASEDIVREAREKMIKRQVKGDKPDLPSKY